MTADPIPVPPAGPVLGEEAVRLALVQKPVRSDVWDVLRPEVRPSRARNLDEITRGVLDALAPHVAALVAAAEQRGAEKAATAIEALDPTIYGKVGHGFGRMAYAAAARAARASR